MADKASPKTPPPHQTGNVQLLLDDPPLWRVIIDGVKSAFEKPPVIKGLESKPIPVKDIFAPPPPLKSRLGSIGLHVAVIAVMLLPMWRPVRDQIKKVVDTTIFVPPAPPPPMPKIMHLAGGGSPNPTPAPVPVMHTVAANPLTPPTAIVPLNDALANNQMFDIGTPGTVGGPPGMGGGTTGAGTGGGGPCTEAEGCASGPGIVPPVQIYAPDPDYSDEARKAKYSGMVAVIVVVDKDGKVSNPRIEQPVGLGLDEQVIKTVSLWRFKPATFNGKPVKVEVEVQVSFRLF